MVSSPVTSCSSQGRADTAPKIECQAQACPPPEALNETHASFRLGQVPLSPPTAASRSQEGKEMVKFRHRLSPWILCLLDRKYSRGMEAGM